MLLARSRNFARGCLSRRGACGSPTDDTVRFAAIRHRAGPRSNQGTDIICSLLVALALTTLATSSAHAQPWSGIIDSSRAIDWRVTPPGIQPGVIGGIPSASWPNCVTAACNTLFGGTVTPTTINSAIASAPANTVVRIPAGNYNLASGITFAGKSNVALRGAGASATVLKISGPVNCAWPSLVCLQGSSGAYEASPAGTASWAAGYAQGATAITLAGVSGEALAVGQLIALDQIMDHADTGGITQCEGNGSPSGSDGFCGGTGQTQGRADRGQTELKRIVDCRADHNTTVGLPCTTTTNVTITPGLYMNNWRAAQSPGAWWWGTLAETLQNAGLEDLTVDHIGDVAQSNITLFNAYNCWLRGVRVIHQSRESVTLWDTSHVTVRDSYFVASKFHQTTAYGIEALTVSDAVIENNIFHYITAPILSVSMGSVISYNYALGSVYDAGGGNLWSFPMFWTHTSGGGMTLIEGNQVGGPGAIQDPDAGNTPLYTFFRNHFRGRDESTVTTVQQAPLIIQRMARADNIIANVLGLSGFNTLYEYSNRTTGPAPVGQTGDGTHTIYELGTQGASTLQWDPVVWTSLLRWGNYDVATGTTRFQVGEVPTAGIPFVNGNPAPSCSPTCLGQIQAIPSLIYPSRPAWFATPWGTPAWPPIGPDVTGGNHPDPNLGGRAYQIPARLCYSNSPTDPAYSGVAPDRGVLAFNAATCYASATSAGMPPVAPSGLALK